MQRFFFWIRDLVQNSDEVNQLSLDDSKID